MLRKFVATLLCVVLVGCGDSYRPVKRDAPAQPAPQVSPSGPAAEMSPDTPAPASGGQVDLAAIRLTAPDSWNRKQPQSGFVAAEFGLPRAEGDDNDGRLTISVAGGSVKDNIDRWRGQFGGNLQNDSQQEQEIAGTQVTVVDFSGTYNDQPGPFAPGVERQGYRMLAAIIPVSDQLHFIKAYGPEKTIAQHEQAFRAFLETLQLK